MKKKLSLLTLALFAIGSFAFAQEEEAAWPEMDAFHTVMSQTWHPIEKGNFDPIKERVDELAAAAAAWSKSDIPAKYAEKKDIKKKLKTLAKETKELAKELKKGMSDEELKEEMSELHDIFHDIVGMCND